MTFLYLQQRKVISLDMNRLLAFFAEKQRIILTIFVYILIFILFLFRLFFAKPFHIFELPLVSVATWTSNQFSNALTPYTVTVETVKRLEAERNAFAIQKIEFEQMKMQNESLQKEINLQKRVSYKTVASHILRRSVSTQDSTFIINAGENQNIQVGSAVIVDDGMFVGKISRVEPNQSVVTASTNFNMTTGVTLFNKSHTIGIAKGSNGNLINLQFVPIDEEIHVNDLVVTSGLESSVPAGLIVGIVNSVKQDIESPFQNAIVEPLSDIRLHNFVLVVIPEV